MALAETYDVNVLFKDVNALFKLGGGGDIISQVRGEHAKLGEKHTKLGEG
jgi:hypothetical protein